MTTEWVVDGSLNQYGNITKIWVKMYINERPNSTWALSRRWNAQGLSDKPISCTLMSIFERWNFGNILHCVLTFPVCMCFFWRALEFWNHTCVTLLLKPVICAILSKSWPSGFESSWKLAWSTCNCSSVNVVRTRFALFLW